MAVATDLTQYVGMWIAQEDRDDVIAAAPTLDDLVRKLLKMHYAQDSLPPIRRVPEDGTNSFLL